MGIFKNLFNHFSGGNEGSKPPMSPMQGGQTFNEDFTEFVNKEYTERQSERRTFELQWRLNAEMLDGNQYLDIDPVSNTLEAIPQLFWWTNRECFNQLSTIVETRVSKLGRQKPSLKVRPATGDDLDQSAAKVSSMLISSTWKDQIMDEQYEDFISWLELTGTAFLKVTWNKSKGRIIYQGQQMEQPAPITSGENVPEEDTEAPTPQFNFPNVEIREGDIETVVVPPHEVFPDSSYRRGMRDCRSIIHAKAYHVNEVEEIWGVRVESEDVDVMTLQRASTGMGSGSSGTGLRTSAKPLKDSVVVKEYYERPTIKYPQGRFIVVAGKKTLYAGPLPYKLGRDGELDFPLIRTVSIDRQIFWGKCVIERCIPIQRRYNALRNRKAEYLNMISVGSWYAPIGSLDEGVELNNAPGNIIHYRPGIGGAKPEPVVWPSLPSSFEMEEQTLMQEFTSVSGVSELSRFAEAPSGVRSGVALAAAAEQDDTRLATSIARVANTAVDLGQKWIRMYRQFVQEPRMLRYIGGNREADVREWQASDLRSDDVYIENLPALSETPGQRRQVVFDLLNAGLFARPELSTMDPETRQKVFSLLEFGHWESGEEDDMYMHKSRARKENRDIMEGIPIMVRDFDDHQLHILTHNRMRMQSEYDELLKTPIGPMIEQMMMAHIAEHIQLALQAMPKEPVEQKADPKSDPKKKAPPKKG